MKRTLVKPKSAVKTLTMRSAVYQALWGVSYKKLQIAQDISLLVAGVCGAVALATDSDTAWIITAAVTLFAVAPLTLAVHKAEERGKQ